MSITKLNKTVAGLSNPTLIDHAHRVASVLNTAIQLAEDGNHEDLELLVILAQDFAGERGQKLQQGRLAAAAETSQVIARAKG